MNSKLILILGISILAAACQKRKYPEDKVQVEKETIYLDGSVDNEPLALKIGTDGYYCYSSYKQTPDSVYLFTGELKKYDCNPCPRSLRVELSDYRVSAPGSSVETGMSFRNGSRNFIPALTKINTVRFTSISNKVVASQKWKVSNGFTSQDAVMNCDFGQPGPQTVSLTVRTTGNCESMVVNTIYISREGDLFACSITSSTLQGNNNSEFTPGITGGTPPFRYTWYFGDGATSTQSVSSHSYTWPGSYPVKLRIEDANNHLCESNFIHVAGNDQSSCAANISLSYAGSRTALLNGVRLQWTDQSNVVLRSDSVDQPAESYFEVVKSEAFEPNEKGEAGQLLTLRFNVLLANGNRRIWFKSENTAIAVSYK
jgi:hypothetical protein